MTPSLNNEAPVWGAIEWAIAGAWSVLVLVFGALLRVGWLAGRAQKRLEALEAAREEDHAALEALRENHHAAERQIAALPQEIARLLEPQFAEMRRRMDRFVDRDRTRPEY